MLKKISIFHTNPTKQHNFQNKSADGFGSSETNLSLDYCGVSIEKWFVVKI